MKLEDFAQRFPSNWAALLDSSDTLVASASLTAALAGWLGQQAITINGTINLSWRWWRVFTQYGRREAFLTLAHESYHAVHQPRDLRPTLRWLAAYLAEWAWLRLRGLPIQAHSKEKPAYAFEAKLRRRLPK